jgi:hypothetical protein
MKSLIVKIFATALFAAVLAGCASTVPESAIQWLERQPWSSDDTT